MHMCIVLILNGMNNDWYHSHRDTHIQPGYHQKYDAHNSNSVINLFLSVPFVLI